VLPRSTGLWARTSFPTEKIASSSTSLFSMTAAMLVRPMLNSTFPLTVPHPHEHLFDSSVRAYRAESNAPVWTNVNHLHRQDERLLPSIRIVNGSRREIEAILPILENRRGEFPPGQSGIDDESTLRVQTGRDERGVLPLSAFPE